MLYAVGHLTLRRWEGSPPSEEAAAIWFQQTFVIQACGPTWGIFSHFSIEDGFFFLILEKFPNFKMWQVMQVCFKHCVCQEKHICRQDSSGEPAVWNISFIELPQHIS